MESRKAISLSRSVCLAIEMVRESLRLVGLDGRWTQVGISSLDHIGGGTGMDRLITLSIFLHLNRDILACCSLQRGGDGEWKSGRLEIWLKDENGRQSDDLDKHWHFVCQLDDNGQLNVRQGY
ncbi:MAG: hypothetical protein AAB863_01055 [Patescibacteria group bacterium]